jgi:hypothetical protein
VTTSSGAKTPLFVVPGNHEASNAVGFYTPMKPEVDATPLIEIYNRMMMPVTPKTTSTYDYRTDRVLYSRDIGGVHFVFLHVWPDSVSRAWMERDLAMVGAATPVVLFTHDQPEGQAKHFRNPNGQHDVNAKDRFENLLADELADGTTIEAPTTIEQRALEAFLARHPNITAYFHGNSNWNQFYDWRGPAGQAALYVFRVDSPMKGKDSAADERRLSFQVASIDTTTYALTVRECLWNVSPVGAEPCVWGESRMINLSQ